VAAKDERALTWAFKEQTSIRVSIVKQDVLGILLIDVCTKNIKLMFLHTWKSS
jgi:hypothetical protein